MEKIPIEIWREILKYNDDRKKLKKEIALYRGELKETSCQCNQCEEIQNWIWKYKLKHFDYGGTDI